PTTRRSSSGSMLGQLVERSVSSVWLLRAHHPTIVEWPAWADHSTIVERVACSGRPLDDRRVACSGRPLDDRLAVCEFGMVAPSTFLDDWSFRCFR
ncbi:hypothetical protein HID58_055536, partial [Brassica napus]